MTRDPPRVSVIIPAYREGEQMTGVLDRLLESVRLPCEVLVVVDAGDDPTVAVVSRYAQREPRLHLLARVGTRDATNSFKAYSLAFIKAVGIDSRDGFEIGIELTAKARRLRRPGSSAGTWSASCSPAATPSPGWTTSPSTGGCAAPTTITRPTGWWRATRGTAAWWPGCSPAAITSSPARR